MQVKVKISFAVMDAFEKKVLKTIEDYHMTKPGEKVVIAVSGGPDSVALFKVLLNLKDYLNIRISVFHLNHKLRGLDSDMDAIFVNKLAENNKIPVYSYSFDVKSFAKKKKLSLEETGRAVRYNLMEKLAQEKGFDKIAVAHHIDDRVETFFIRLIRGASLDGLASIPPVRGKVIRPLFNVRKSEILSYLKRTDQDYRIDLTNFTLDNLRAQIRNSLIPVVTEMNPKIRENLIENLETVRDDAIFLNALAKAEYRKRVQKKDGLIYIPVSLKKRIPKALLVRIIKLAIADSGGDLKLISRTHLETLYRGLDTDTGFEYHLPGKLLAVTEYGYMLIGYTPRLLREEIEPQYFEVPSKVALKPTPFILTAEFVEGEIEIETDKNVCYLDAEKAGTQFMVRSWRKGDRLVPLGMSGSRKLHDIFIDQKIPKRMRKQVPVIVAENSRIAWAGGLKISDEFKITDSTKKAIRLKLIEKRGEDETDRS